MSESPEIDFTKIDFPSDGLTIKTLRRLSPDHFDSEPEACAKLLHNRAGNPMGDVLTLLDAERMVAQGAFFKTVGVQCSRDYLEDVRGCAQDVAKLYVHFGIAKGQHHAEQLIRDIESQAVKQTIGKRP
jgi:hypothetical protein